MVSTVVVPVYGWWFYDFVLIRPVMAFSRPAGSRGCTPEPNFLHLTRNPGKPGYSPDPTLLTCPFTPPPLRTSYYTFSVSPLLFPALTLGPLRGCCPTGTRAQSPQVAGEPLAAPKSPKA